MWYFERIALNRGRVAATLPIMIPRPGSTAVRIASLAVASGRELTNCVVD